MTEKLRLSKGCYGGSENVLHKLDKNQILFRSCVGNFFSDVVVRWLEMYHAYEKGVLPYPGCYSEQPNKIIEVFQVFEKHKHDKLEREYTNKKRERQRK